MFMREVSGFASGLAELPLIELTLRFSVQIGSESEPVEYTRVLRTSSYSEEKLSALYGDLYLMENSSTLYIESRTKTPIFLPFESAPIPNCLPSIIRGSRNVTGM